MTKKYANNFIDKTGQIIGNWVVLKRIERIQRRDPIWLCKCKLCDQEKEVSGNSLRNGSKSCGCWKHYIKPPPVINVTPVQAKTTTIRARYRNEAIRRNLEFSLSKEQFFDIIMKECFYCSKIGQNCQKMQNGESFYYNGIDRVDNNKGYLLENCVPCCKKCNVNKKSITPDMIYKAYHFLFGEK